MSLWSNTPGQAGRKAECSHSCGAPASLPTCSTASERPDFNIRHVIFYIIPAVEKSSVWLSSISTILDFFT